MDWYVLIDINMKMYTNLFQIIIKFLMNIKLLFHHYNCYDKDLKIHVTCFVTYIGKSVFEMVYTNANIRKLSRLYWIELYTLHKILLPTGRRLLLGWFYCRHGLWNGLVKCNVSAHWGEQERMECDAEKAQQSRTCGYVAHLRKAGGVKGKRFADLPRNLGHTFTIYGFGCL